MIVIPLWPPGASVSKHCTAYLAANMSALSKGAVSGYMKRLVVFMLCIVPISAKQFSKHHPKTLTHPTTSTTISTSQPTERHESIATKHHIRAPQPRRTIEKPAEYSTDAMANIGQLVPPSSILGLLIADALVEKAGPASHIYQSFHMCCQRTALSTFCVTVWGRDDCDRWREYVRNNRRELVPRPPKDEPDEKAWRQAQAQLLVVHVVRKIWERHAGLGEALRSNWERASGERVPPPF